MLLFRCNQRLLPAVHLQTMLTLPEVDFKEKLYLPSSEGCPVEESACVVLNAFILSRVLVVQKVVKGDSNK